MTYRELDAALRNDFSAFIHKVFRTVSPEIEYHPNWHIEAIAHHLEQCRLGETKRQIITLPPRHLKSICASVALPAWLLGHDPTCRIICASYSAELQRKHANDFRLVMESDWYRDLFPGTRIDPRKNTETEIATTARGFRYSTSVGGSLTGRGANFIILDDSIKPEDATSKAERDHTNQWFDGTLYSRLDSKKDDVIVLVMQRLHQDDLVGHVLEKEDWVQLNIPAIAEERSRYLIGPNQYHYRNRGDVLHPAREDRESLDATRNIMGTYNFAAQYQQQPMPPQGNLVKRDWFRFYDELPGSASFNAVVQSWDVATSGNELGDFSVCSTWGVRGQDYFLIDLIRARLEYPELKRRVIQAANRQGADYILIERAGPGRILFQELRRELDVSVRGIQPREDKESRLAAESAKFEAGQVFLPKSAPWLDEFTEELLSFPGARHDDQVDSVTQFLRWVGRQGNLCRDGERPQGRDRPQGFNRPAGRPFRPIRRLRPGWPQIF